MSSKTKAAASSSSTSVKKTSSDDFPLVAYATSLILSVAFYLIADTYKGYTGAPASTKPYDTFTSFYPFYLSQHSNLICQRWHFAGTSFFFVFALVYSNGLRIASALLPPLILGAGICLLTRSVPHGLWEGLAMLAFFLILLRVNLGSWKKVATGASVLIVGYGCAWIGHFYFEMNKPATFIYPSYSLMGDFRMFFDICTGQRPF